MQIRELWKGRHGEPHGVRIGANELEIRTKTHGRTRITRITLEPDCVRVVDTLPDGLMAETVLEQPVAIG